MSMNMIIKSQDTASRDIRYTARFTNVANHNAFQVIHLHLRVSQAV